MSQLINDLFQGRDKQRLMSEVYEAYARTPVLQQLASGKRLVPGAGPLDSPLAIIAEAPGEQEDRKGEPLIGPAGQLLQKLFRRAGLPWELCYRTNVLPWRPPGNRTPYPFEVIASRQRLRAELTLVSPLVVVCCGATAWSGLSQDGLDLGGFADRCGSWVPEHYDTWRLLVIRHPSAILRERGAARTELEDLTVSLLSSVLEGTGD